MHINILCIKIEIIYNFVRKSLEVQKDYDLGLIIKNDKDEVEKEIEIDKIFNRMYENEAN